MVNTKNKAPLISAITTHYKYTRKRRLSPIRLLGSPQATIHYGEVYAYKVSTHPICIGSFIARFISEVVIQIAIELKYVKIQYLFWDTHCKFSHIYPIDKELSSFAPFLFMVSFRCNDRIFLQKSFLLSPHQVLSSDCLRLVFDCSCFLFFYK